MENSMAEHGHASVKTYLVVAAVLGIITAAEVAIFYIDALRPVLVPTAADVVGGEIHARRKFLHAPEVRLEDLPWPVRRASGGRGPDHPGDARPVRRIRRRWRSGMSYPGGRRSAYGPDFAIRAVRHPGPAA